MNFIEAISAVFNDSDHVTRQAWNNRSIYLLMEDGKLCIKGFDGSKPDDGLAHPLIVSEQDFFAHDWEILSEA